MNLHPLRAALVMFVLASVACADFDLEKQKLCKQLPERCGDADGSMGDWTGGALNVTLGYSGFTRGCVTVTATDAENAGNTNSLDVALPGKKAGTVSVMVFRKKTWGRALSVTTQLREVDCSGPLVGDPQKARAQVPEEGTLDVPFTVRANDADGDGFFSSDDAEGVVSGTDCKDGDHTVNPSATEVCNGQDDNCTLGESDAIDKLSWYTDVDGDGYGSTQVEACTQPTGTVATGWDCNDGDPQVRPGRAEFRCDGKDDNCNGINDEDFGVDNNCEDDLRCAGKIACASTPSQTACVRLPSENPVVWYVDGDGDGFRGQAAGLGCESPVVGGVSQSEDCDESSVYVRIGLTEACDRLDNNCSGVVDEGCAPLTWTTDAGVLGPADRLNSIALYDQGQKGWIAGPNKLAHLDSASPGIKEFTDGSCRKPWNAAWASQDGRVFVVGEDGWLSTRKFVEANEECFTPQVPTDKNNTDFNGVFGIDDPVLGATVFAVASNGKIYRWAPPYFSASDLIEIAQVPANLRAIGGLKSVDSLIAVGNANADLKAQAYRANSTGATWTAESLGVSATAFMRGVHVLNGHYAYAAGDNGRVYEWTGGAGWKALPQLPIPNGGTAVPEILDVLSFSKNGTYAVTTANTIAFFNGSTWSTVHTAAQTLRSLDGPRPTRITAAGDGSTVVNFTALAPLAP
ncbi:putative metal-binding motif-containing protein [Corallococcus exiguus]|uniref:putative metal-binding motif-containing protein n=1 Tax=Corallococcus exiguus TaxID=83462 RepID=UPI001A8F8FA2|nr:putative metal-binding motif-containing protein [Corallococcus exiguus]MBN8465240.1 putative metal-binding motif-containing protein [Corallococcus exiguus]